MPSVDEIYVSSGNWLKANDIDDDLPATISEVEVVEMKDGQRKVVLSLVGDDGRPVDGKLVCNWTNSQKIAEAYGKLIEGWVNRKITLFPDRVKFQGKLVDSIGVRVPRKGSAVNLPKPAAKTFEAHDGADPDLDDEIPF